MEPNIAVNVNLIPTQILAKAETVSTVPFRQTAITNTFKYNF